MPKPKRRESSHDQELFDATLSQLLATPPKPHKAKKAKRKPKAGAKAKPKGR